MEISKEMIKYPQPRAFETKDHIYINNVACDKKTLSAVPYNTVIAVNDVGSDPGSLYNSTYVRNPLVHFSESTYALSSTMLGQDNGLWMPSMIYINQKKSVRDIDDENIQYIILGGYSSRIIKLNTRTNEYDVMKDIPNYVYEIIHQTDEHLYITYYNEGFITTSLGHSSPHAIGIIRINKKTYESDIITNILPDSTNICCTSLIVHKDDKKIIFEQIYGIAFTVNSFDSISTVFYKCLDLNTFSISTIRASANTSTMNNAYFPTMTLNSIKLNKDSVTTYYPTRHLYGGFKFIKSTTNITDEYITNSGSIEAHVVEVEFGEGNPNLVNELNDVFSKNEKVCFVTTAKNGKHYLTLFLRKTQSTALSRELSGIYVFELVADEQIVYKNKLFLDGSERNMHRIDENYNNIYVMSDNCTYNLKFNQDIENYEVVSSIDLTAAALSTDEFNRVWLLDKNGSLHLFDESIGDKVNISFASENLVYDGIDFDTNILVNCTNVSEEKISEEIELRISGNAKFKENSSDRISLFTSNKADIVVELIINGPGQIYIYPNIIM